LLFGSIYQHFFPVMVYLFSVQPVLLLLKYRCSISFKSKVEWCRLIWAAPVRTYSLPVRELKY